MNLRGPLHLHTLSFTQHAHILTPLVLHASNLTSLTILPRTLILLTMLTHLIDEELQLKDSSSTFMLAVTVNTWPPQSDGISQLRRFP